MRNDNGVGVVTAETDYDPFGFEVRSGSPATAEQRKFKFTGKERDVESGLDYFGHRYYDSLIGRFISADPMATKAPGWSPYAYAADNPINNIDRFGLWTDPIKKLQYKGHYGKGWAPDKSKFGKVRTDSTPYHQGVDLYAKVGTEAFAVEKGTVIEVNKSHKDFGGTVVLKFTTKDKEGKESTKYARYAHLDTIDDGIKKDTEIKEGAKIGTTGKTGNAKDLPDKEAHLHFEIATKEVPGIGEEGNKNREDPANSMTIKDANKDDQKEEKKE